LAGLNKALCGKFQGHFVTAAYILIDTEKQSLSYAGAGHPPLILRDQSAAATREFVENGLFLGYFPEATYTAVELPFKTGDWCVLYTDGIPETTNLSDEQFGVGRFKDFLENNHDLSPGKFVDRFLDELSRWSGGASREPEDDITLLAIHFKDR
jgi:sigma-B regulation protein RsbU (phosphoserine phosphatase)